jgi:hypothetical protein
MGKTSNASKQKWNAANYTQVKVSVPTELASAFKSACSSADTSMAKVISDFMKSYCSKHDPSPTKTAAVWHSGNISTRPLRRREAAKIARHLEDMRDAEEDYMARMPENLQGSSRYDSAEQSVESLTDAIAALEAAY